MVNAIQWQCHHPAQVSGNMLIDLRFRDMSGKACVNVSHTALLVA
jgi:hypothetical protein